MRVKESDVIEILGPWLLNKGDDLMLRAILQKLQGAYTLGVSSTLGLRDLPSELGLLDIRWPPTRKEIWDAVSSFSSSRWRSMLRRGVGLQLASQRMIRSRGFVDGRELSALLDCSGFAYGDQWSPRRLWDRINYYQLLKSHGVKLIMLPQALGPFQDPTVIKPARILLDCFDLIFARDEFSSQHVASLDITPTKVGVCPDITHLLEAEPPQDLEVWASRVAIVPNARMLDRTSAEVSQRYIDFLSLMIRCTDACGFEPVVILHESNDRDLVREVCHTSGSNSLSVIDEDALVTKGYLGACHAVVGSRYHSLVSSLSQGIPSIGTSWTHKYDALFKEYDCTHCLVSPLDDQEKIEKLYRDFLGSKSQKELRLHLNGKARRQKEKVLAMWERVEGFLR